MLLFILSLMAATMMSSLLFVSLSVSASGAMSLSWKQKNGTPSFSQNSKHASTFAFARSIGSVMWFQGLTAVLTVRTGPFRLPESMPVCHGKPQVVLHPLARHDFVRL